MREPIVLLQTHFHSANTFGKKAIRDGGLSLKKYARMVVPIVPIRDGGPSLKRYARMVAPIVPISHHVLSCDVVHKILFTAIHSKWNHSRTGLQCDVLFVRSTFRCTMHLFITSP